MQNKDYEGEESVSDGGLYLGSIKATGTRRRGGLGESPLTGIEREAMENLSWIFQHLVGEIHTSGLIKWSSTFMFLRPLGLSESP